MVLPVIAAIAAAAVCGVLATYPVFRSCVRRNVPPVPPVDWDSDEELERKLYNEKMNDLMKGSSFEGFEGSSQYNRNLTSN